MYLRIKSMQSGTAGLGMGGGDWNIQIITQKSTYFWTTTSTMMWCYRCCTTLGNGGQVTCWFSTVQRHYTIWTCTIQCGMWCMQSLEIDVENIHVQKWIWAMSIHTHTLSLFLSHSHLQAISMRMDANENGRDENPFNTFYGGKLFKLYVIWFLLSFIHS